MYTYCRLKVQSHAKSEATQRDLLMQQTQERRPLRVTIQHKDELHQNR